MRSLFWLPGGWTLPLIKKKNFSFTFFFPRYFLLSMWKITVLKLFVYLFTFALLHMIWVHITASIPVEFLSLASWCFYNTSLSSFTAHTVSSTVKNSPFYRTPKRRWLSSKVRWLWGVTVKCKCFLCFWSWHVFVFQLRQKTASLHFTLFPNIAGVFSNHHFQELPFNSAITKGNYIIQVQNKTCFSCHALVTKTFILYVWIYS